MLLQLLLCLLLLQLLLCLWFWWPNIVCFWVLLYQLKCNFCCCYLFFVVLIFTIVVVLLNLMFFFCPWSVPNVVDWMRKRYTRVVRVGFSRDVLDGYGCWGAHWWWGGFCSCLWGVLNVFGLGRRRYDRVAVVVPSVVAFSWRYPSWDTWSSWSCPWLAVVVEVFVPAVVLWERDQFL